LTTEVFEKPEALYIIVFGFFVSIVKEVKQLFS
ncbi:MAG: hypothetical protein H6Q18_870, partial [Bacteroidetes bacterium]|nr:hypothetical protein [Bacteroidota bacterium]